MIVYGKERYFKLTVGASAAIADQCPDGDLTRIAEVFAQPYAAKINFLAHFIAALNAGYERARAFEDPTYQADPLTVPQIGALDQDTFLALQHEAMASFNGDVNTKIETEPAEKSKKKPV